MFASIVQVVKLNLGLGCGAWGMRFKLRGRAFARNLAVFVMQA